MLELRRAKNIYGFWGQIPLITTDDQISYAMLTIYSKYVLKAYITNILCSLYFYQNKYLLRRKKWKLILIFFHTSARNLWRIILCSMSTCIWLPGVRNCILGFGLISYAASTMINKQYWLLSATLLKLWSHLLNISFQHPVT